MITVTLMGGMGNQMFQRAFGLALESRGHAVNYCGGYMPDGTHRQYSLDYFGELPFGKHRGPHVLEANMRFNPANLSPIDPCRITGYWQSEKYFADIAPRVRDAFRFRTALSSRAVDIQICMRRTDSIFMHVRRQDYVHLQSFHGMMTVDWYRRALDYITASVPDPSVYIFSDDPAWCEANFSYPVVKNLTKYEDLELMTSCKHAITANSSFSWWGAWLGESNCSGIVIAPQQWFSSPSMQGTYADIVPERWVKL